MAGACIFVIRHGQTGGNGNHYVGREDEPLDSTGIAQADALVDRLHGQPITAIYSSPLSRARRTAAPLAAARGLAIVVRDDLQEIDYGRYQGMLKADQPIKLRHDHRFQRMPDGESLHDVYLRLEHFAQQLQDDLRRGAQLAIVGHFWSNRMLVGILMGIPFAALFEQTRYKPGNASVYQLRYAATAGPPAVTECRWFWQPGEGAGE